MIRVNDVRIHYNKGSETVEAVKGISLDINEGDYIAIIGPSGSGKSSLLGAIAGLIQTDSGDIFIAKHKLTRARREKKAHIRAYFLGVIFQFSEMISRYTVRENLKAAWAVAAAETRPENFDERLEFLSGRLQLSQVLDSRITSLSGGELQKAAVARALIKKPPFLLADEPTGDLDPESSQLVHNLLKEENENGMGILLITHSAELAKEARTIYEMRDGTFSNINEK